LNFSSKIFNSSSIKLTGSFIRNSVESYNCKPIIYVMWYKNCTNGAGKK
jgi:hypothetical protein